MARVRDASVALAALFVAVAALLLAFGPEIASTQRRLDRVRNERTGVADARALHAMVELLVPLSGHAPGTGRDIDAALQRLSTLEARRPMLGSSLDAIGVAWSARDPADPALLQSISAALRDVIRRSRLDTDVDPGVVLLASQVVNRLTSDAITAKQAGDEAARYAAAPTLEGRLQLAGAAARVRMIGSATDEYLGVARSTSRLIDQALADHAERARRASAALVEAAHTMELADAPRPHVAILRGRIVALEDAIDGTVDTALPLIEASLARRESALERTRTTLIVVTSLFIGICLLVVPLLQRALRARGHLRHARMETERLQAIVGRAQAEARFRAVFERAALGIAVFRRDGTLKEANPALLDIFGTTADGLIGRKVGDFTHPDDRARTFASMERLVRGEMSSYQIEKRYVKADGTVIWADVTVSLIAGDDGTEPLAISLIDDVSERVAMRERLIHEASHDALTGLANRPLFLERVARALERGERGAFVAFVDLDHFKDVNDSLGHATGDALLTAIADRLVEHTRSDDGEVVARLGGDEFALLLFVEGNATLVARRVAAILEAIAAAVPVDDRMLFTTASIGIAALDGRYSDPGDALRDADIALYRAKHDGRNRAMLFDSAMHDGAVRTMQLTQDLRSALERDGEIVVAFQPIVALDGAAVVAHEALVRWQHPAEGLLPPDTFIPLAESSGLIIPLGAHVLRTSLAWLAREIVRRPAATVHVNISVRELRSGDIATLVAAELARHGVPPASLVLEITEGAVIDPESPSVAALEQLRALGVRVCVDDFGIGYSSLRYLRSLPITDLKIDRSFVHGAGDGLAAPAIVRMLLQLADSLQLAVVAEGIETAAQAEQLAALGCHFGQGFYFGAAALPEVVLL